MARRKQDRKWGSKVQDYRRLPFRFEGIYIGTPILASLDNKKHNIANNCDKRGKKDWFTSLLDIRITERIKDCKQTKNKQDQRIFRQILRELELVKTEYVDGKEWSCECEKIEEA